MRIVEVKHRAARGLRDRAGGSINVGDEIDVLRDDLRIDFLDLLRDDLLEWLVAVPYLVLQRVIGYLQRVDGVEIMGRIADANYIFYPGVRIGVKLEGRNIGSSRD